MKLKDIIELIKEDDYISIYSPAENIYEQQEIIKCEYDKAYDNFKVIEIETNLTSGGWPVIEISIEE